MKNILFAASNSLLAVLFSLTMSPLQAGTVRDGGDEPITSPHWECVNEDQSVQVKVDFKGRNIQVIAAENFVFEEVYLDLTTILRPVKLSDDQYQPLGPALQWSKFIDGTHALAFSIYLEKRVQPQSNKPKYEARISTRWSGLNIYAEPVVCSRNQFADHVDMVYGEDFIQN